MKKINEQTKSFLLYGIEDVIKPKEIYKLDGAILFLVFLFFFLSLAITSTLTETLSVRSHLPLALFLPISSSVRCTGYLNLKPMCCFILYFTSLCAAFSRHDREAQTPRLKR